MGSQFTNFFSIYLCILKFLYFLRSRKNFNIERIKVITKNAFLKSTKLKEV